MISDLITAAATIANCTRATMLSGQRRADLVRARHAAMWLAVQTGASLPVTGRAFHRDHTSILHAVRKVDAIVKNRESKEALVRMKPETAIAWLANALNSDFPPLAGARNGVERELGIRAINVVEFAIQNVKGAA
jgi:hypothetical protein